MTYVEIHPGPNGGVQIRFDPSGERDEPFVTNTAILGGVLSELGVRAHGEWEIVEGPDGKYQRALILS